MKQLEQIRLCQQLLERRKVLDRERIDTAKPLPAADLDQRQLRVVGFLANELGIDGTVTRRAELGAD